MIWIHKMKRYGLKYANEDYFLCLDFDDTFKGQFIKEM